MDQLSGLVSKQLKIADEALKTHTTSRDHVDWSQLKRTPQFLKQKMRFSNNSFTVDEEFNELESDLIHLEKNLISFVKYTKIFVEVSERSKVQAEIVGNTFKELFDPYKSLTKGLQIDTDSFDRQYSSWQEKVVYVDGLKVLEDPERQTHDKLIEVKVGELLKIIKTISKRCKQRSVALLDYDLAYNDHENLTLKQREGGVVLTIKQSQQLHCLERKKDANKKIYDQLNDELKIKLPYFFKLVNNFLYQCQLSTLYHKAEMFSTYVDILQNNSQLLNIDYKELINVDIQKLIRDCEIKNGYALDEINKLSIINFRESYLSELTRTPTPTPIISTTGDDGKYCKAIYKFEAQQKDDLSIEPGDLIQILDKDGLWWKGIMNGKTGVFPSNYVSEL
ncbi:uncharacterized protein RJT21DRAFT_114727 [Scheffersomyces amazonensis]|uniref:uncharacterized protein n=1 Tax=Scheffersomyces amazonensis TaxID=1078765 RepID=UPI00315C9E18